MKPVRTVARSLLSAIFVTGGYQAVTNPEQLVPGARRVTDRIGPVVEPLLGTADPAALVRLNGAVQLAGGVLLACGVGTRIAAGALAATLLPTTVAGHPFWAAADPAQRREQQAHLIKNLGLLGGLLLAVVDTGGRPGLRWRTGRYVADARRSADHARQAARRQARTAYRQARLARRAARVGSLAGRHLPS